MTQCFDYDDRFDRDDRRRYDLSELSGSIGDDVDLVSPERLGTGGNSKSNRSVYWFFLSFLPRRGLES